MKIERCSLYFWHTRVMATRVLVLIHEASLHESTRRHQQHVEKKKKTTDGKLSMPKVHVTLMNAETSSVIRWSTSVEHAQWYIVFVPRGVFRRNHFAGNRRLPAYITERRVPFKSPRTILRPPFFLHWFSGCACIAGRRAWLKILENH